MRQGITHASELRKHQSYRGHRALRKACERELKVHAFLVRADIYSPDNDFGNHETVCNMRGECAER